VGTQQRSIVHLQKACELIREGHIGRVCKVHMRWNRNYTRMTTEDPVVDESTVDWKTWLGPAKGRPFNAFVFRNWRWFWDFGGGTFIDLMSHWMDMTCWFLGLNLPQTVAALGDRFLYKDKWETPDQSIAIMQFPSQEVDVCFESSFRNHRFDASVEFMGSDATMYVDRGRYEIYPERGSKVKASEMQVGTGTRGSSDYREINGQVNHLTNWIECVRSRKDPAASVESAVLAAQICHMANQALREKRVVTRA
jgi:predicted dehydrogenase